jgi:hypothetical protein
MTDGFAPGQPFDDFAGPVAASIVDGDDLPLMGDLGEHFARRADHSFDVGFLSSSRK